MSAKSLLQIILLILIFFVVAAIYFLYFYSGPLKERIILGKNLTTFNQETIEKKDTSSQEILEEIVTSKNEEVKKKKNHTEEKDFNSDNEESKNYIKKTEKKNVASKNLSENKNSEIKNLTKEIEYITTNKDGDIFKILAKYGKTNIEKSNILDLENVEGIISSNKRSPIYIVSDFASYNYDNQNSEFYKNVEIKYDEKIITCDNLDLKISENYAIAYKNVKIKDKNSIMKAQKVKLDILTKDIKINSDEKIKIITN